MKNLIFGITIAAFSLTACTSDSNKTSENTNEERNTSQANSDVASTEPNNTPSINEIISGYLQLKNALANDNGDEAAKGSKALANALQKFDKTSLTGEQMKIYADLEGDMKEHAEHIESNADKIDHQREHFDMLSKDIYDLVKAFDAGQTLYQDYCPMYNNNKGAIWLSETKEIKNPYMGKKMATCGEMKEEI